MMSSIQQSSSTSQTGTETVFEAKVRADIGSVLPSVAARSDAMDAITDETDDGTRTIRREEYAP